VLRNGLLARDDGKPRLGSKHACRNLNLLLACRGLNRYRLQIDLEASSLLRSAVCPRARVRVPGPSPSLGLAAAKITNLSHRSNSFAASQPIVYI